MPPDLSEKNFEGTIEQVQIQTVPAVSAGITGKEKRPVPGS